jgi:hypothetical protein
MTTSQNTPSTTTEQTEFVSHGFPRFFIGFQAEYGHAALEKWLNEQNAPQEIKDLAEGLAGCAIFLTDPGEELDPQANDALTDSLIHIARGMHFVGVQLHTPDSTMRA